LSNWDIAIIPFERNESTKYISPTKTPEYLAGGKPVISTSIMDVVNPYGNNGFVHIADSPSEFIAAAEKEFSKSSAEYLNWLKQVDDYLKNISWDKCVNDMLSYIDSCLMTKEIVDSNRGGFKSVA